MYIGYLVFINILSVFFIFFLFVNLIFRKIMNKKYRTNLLFGFVLFTLASSIYFTLVSFIVINYAEKVKTRIDKQCQISACPEKIEGFKKYSKFENERRLAKKIGIPFYFTLVYLPIGMNKIEDYRLYINWGIDAAYEINVSKE